jgi:hypothetical protein
VAQFLANIATGTGALSGNQSTSTTSGGGGFFSDERLKENVQKVGETNDGQPIYRYNYKGDKRTQIGLLAQEVEKDHPEAVGLAGGYKTVDYKKATDRAVHKAEGGETTDAYSMDAPSQMLGKPAGLGALQLPQMRTEGIAVRSMTPAAEIEALRAPKAPGFSPGTMEAARAERSSLASAPSNGIGSGPAYVANRMTELDKFLAANSSQGGLVGPQGGDFAYGGFALGGGSGPYGVQLDPMQQRQMMQGMQAPAPQQRNALAEAKQWGDLATMGYAGYKNRPDFLRSAGDVAARQQTEAASKVAELQKLEWAKEHGVDIDTLLGKAHGGLIGDRDGFKGQGYVNAGSNPYGGGGGYRRRAQVTSTIRRRSLGRRGEGMSGLSPRDDQDGGEAARRGQVAPRCGYSQKNTDEGDPSAGDYGAAHRRIRRCGKRAPVHLLGSLRGMHWLTEDIERIDFVGGDRGGADFIGVCSRSAFLIRISRA